MFSWFIDNHRLEFCVWLFPKYPTVADVSSASYFSFLLARKSKCNGYPNIRTIFRTGSQNGRPTRGFTSLDEEG